MIIKLIVPVLLALCGASFASSAQAADYFCHVYSGDTLQPSTAKDGHYKATAADAAAAEQAVLKKVAGIKKGVTLTRARCETSQAALASAPTAAAAVSAPAPAPSAPATAGTTYYCWIYKGNELLPPAAGHDAGNEIWKVQAASPAELEDAAVALAKSFNHPDADSAMCRGSVERLMEG